MQEQVQRLDRTQPPPDAGVVSKADISREHVLAEMWGHYEREHDPPGLETWEDPEYGWWFFSLGDDFDWQSMLAAKTGTAQRPGADQAHARAAAWAWYWRRIDLSRALECFEFYWPASLAWADEQVAEVERWLAEGGILPPAVLRAR